VKERAVSMEDAVGYPAICCESQTPVEHGLVLKHDEWFLLANAHGDITPPGHCALGLFQRDTRLASHLALSVCGGPPSLLAVQAPRSYLGRIDLAVNDRDFDGDPWDPKNCIHLQRNLLLSDRFLERLELVNYLPRALEYWVELRVGCDFSDIFEVRGWKRGKRGQFFAPEVGGDFLGFRYRGLDGRLLQSFMRFSDPPTRITAGGARWEFRLSPHAPRVLEWEIQPGAPSGRTLIRFDEAHEMMAAQHRDWIGRCSRWNTVPRDFGSVLARSVDDLNALHLHLEGRRVPSAGIPWYATIFGRDSLITALETLPLNPDIARETLRYLARYQGEKMDRFTEEEPGKILHELRGGEMARAREIPHVPYYGSIDATPLWIVLLHETWLWTGDDAFVREMLPHAERALEWILNHGDKDGDGLVEYLGSTDGKGLANQGWKDSGDGVPFPDASLPRPPIALVEVQGYVYDAFGRLARLWEVLGKTSEARALRERAAALRRKIVEQFWMEEEGVFALALDGSKTPLRTITSNAGHLLWSGVPDARQARRLADCLLSSRMYSGWGIRTLAQGQEVYNPMSYHNGSVWPHDNALILLGLARQGFGPEAVPVLESLYGAATCDEFQRLPELFCGMTRRPGLHPVWYPVSCSPQAWAAGALFLSLQAVLGLEADAPAGVLHVRHPALPLSVRELTIDDLRVGEARVSLHFTREENMTTARVLSIAGGNLEVRVESGLEFDEVLK
jgi:glycogen debranching enzyme